MLRFRKGLLMKKLICMLLVCMVLSNSLSALATVKQDITKDKEYKINVFSEFIKKIIDAGGLMAYAKEIA